jgi:hypothetical protein
MCAALAERIAMEWTAPTYTELKMDAEIGSYQEDRDERDPSPIARPERREDEPSAG